MDQKQMFYQAHKLIMEKYHWFVEIQASDNPLTEAEIEELIRRYPGQYDFMKGRE